MESVITVQKTVKGHKKQEKDTVRLGGVLFVSAEESANVPFLGELQPYTAA